MIKIVDFFLKRTKLNYSLFIILILSGIFAYGTIAKDVFPVIKIDKVIVSGFYTNISNDALNKMAVIPLENELKSLEGIQKIESFISQGSFTIVLTLDEYANEGKILDKTKNIISNAKSDLPSDMNEPSAYTADWKAPLINVIFSSSILSKDKLIDIADEIKNKLLLLKNVSEVVLFEDTKKVFEVIFDNRKIELYNLNKDILFEEIKRLSNIFPIGQIDDEKESYFLSNVNGKKSVKDYLNTLLKIDDKTIYLKDIARVEYKRNEEKVISKINGKSNVQLAMYKNDKADAIILAKEVKDYINNLNQEYENINISVVEDSSVLIKNRLNTIVSGILFGLILLTLALYILINKRVAFIVVLGIPTAILFALVFLSFTTYSINMITLIGVLLVLGILVDDAIIIAENIQRHIVLGENKFKATKDACKEVMLPVLASSLTTVFAFLPMMVLTNELGQFLILIPVSVIILIIASLIESYIFLPIHALHILKKDDKELDWTKALNLYSNFLHKIIDYKKTFLLLFIIIIPLLTLFLASTMKYNLLPEFDSNEININGSFKKNTKVKETFEKSKIFEEILLKHKNELFIKTISYGIGYKVSDDDFTLKESLFNFQLELHAKKPENFMEEYIAPILALNKDDREKIRVLSDEDIIEKIKKLFHAHKPDNLKTLTMSKAETGITDNDIEILLSSKDEKLLNEASEKIEETLKNIHGLSAVKNNTKLGTKELKLKLNTYGESLGFNEEILFNSLRSSFSKTVQNKGLNKEGIFDLISYDENKDDINTLIHYELNIPNTNKKIFLSEICDFEFKQTFEFIEKINQYEVKTISANVNNKIITATEALDLLKNILEKYERLGIKVMLEGEEEQNERMLKEMSLAFIIALILIFFTLLLLFNSFRLSFMILALIPFSFLGSIIGHLLLDLNLSLTSIIGLLGLAGVVVNDAIVMLEFMRHSRTVEEVIARAKLRLRPILITSITTFLGLISLIFFASGQAKVLQPIAVSLGFGLLWGTVLTLVFLPTFFSLAFRIKKEK